MEGKKIHILALPYPAAGHITPLLHFTKRLSSKGLKITLVIPTITCKSSAKAAAQAAKIHNHGEEEDNFKIEYISDGSENNNSISIVDYFSNLKAEVSKNLSILIQKLMTMNTSSSSDYPQILIYDSTMPWVLNIAREYGLLAAPFFTECFGVNYIYYNIFQGKLKKLSSINDDNKSVVISLPPLPPLEIDDLPCHPTIRCFDDAVIEGFFSNQFLNLHEADWIFINTFYELENEVASLMSSKWPIKTIGPTILRDDHGGIFTQESTNDHNTDDHELKNIKKKSDQYSCMEWLDKKELNSVVYISFGTVAQLSQEQMEEIAMGIISSNCNFLWIIRDTENYNNKQLPLLESEKGLVLKWCPQLEVLGHKSVACFVTHCGWNSTIEALSLGVPTIGMPFLVDQTTNAKFITDVWEVGVRVKANGKGIYNREEIEMCIKEVTQSKRGKELKQNVMKWKKEIEKAIALGGSSSKNIDNFVAELSSIVHLS